MLQITVQEYIRKAPAKEETIYQSSTKREVKQNSPTKEMERMQLWILQITDQGKHEDSSRKRRNDLPVLDEKKER